MDKNHSNTITSFVNTDWILSLCEQEILNERMIHEGIGPRINVIAQAELRGFIRAIRKVQELTLLSITEDVATLSCDDIMLDEHGDVIILDGRIKVSPSPGEIGPSSPHENQEFTVQYDATTPHLVIQRSRASSSMKHEK
jgi:hypothetical protein